MDRRTGGDGGRERRQRMRGDRVVGVIWVSGLGVGVVWMSGRDVGVVWVSGRDGVRLYRSRGGRERVRKRGN